MQHLEDILTQIESILDLLIQNAEKLQEVSHQVIAHEELISLQERQEELLKQLLKSDEEFSQACQGGVNEYQSPIRTRIAEKLEQFQNLNSQFITNIMATRGLIQFEINKNKKK
jgi:hypothetical protein